MKRSAKKLSLNRETIVGLSDQLEGLGGGITASCGITVCCSTPWAGCGSNMSQCITVCIPCQTATACVK